MSEKVLLETANWLLEGLHIAVILINCFFWMIPALRIIRRFVYGMTLTSWVVAGYYYGWGYCFLTDIHWDIKRRLGAESLPHSYVTYALEKYLQWTPSEDWIYYTTLAVFMIISLIVLTQSIAEAVAKSQKKSQ